MPHRSHAHIPQSNDPIVAAEQHADPRHLPLGDLWREQSTLRLALTARQPGRVALVRRLVAVEAALITGGGDDTRSPAGSNP